MNRFAIASMLSVAGLAAAASGQTIALLPLPVGDFVIVDAISADGTKIVGQASTSNAFIDTGMVFDVPTQTYTLVGGQADATTNTTGRMRGISPNGQWAVGQAGSNRLPNVNSTATRPGLIYNVATGQKIELPDTIDTSIQIAYGYGVSNSGQRAVGFNSASANGLAQRAVRWEVNTGTGIAGAPINLPLPTVVGTISSSRGQAISGDGATVAGRLDLGGSNPRGFVIENVTGSSALLLPDLPGGSEVTDVEKMNAAGTVIVGTASGTAGAFTGSVGAFWKKTAPGTWTVTGLEPLPGATSAIAKATTEDGSRIFGETIGGGANRAFVWSSASGSQSLRDLALAAGVPLDGGDQLNSVEGVSSDGTTILGFGTFGGQSRIYLLTLPATNACPNPSNVAGANQSTTPDDALTADDIIVFLGWYFANDSRADVAGPNQSTTPDSALTADDIIVFLGRYFSGC